MIRDSSKEIFENLFSGSLPQILPAKEEPFSKEDGGVPPEMWDGKPDNEGWVNWKPVMSPLSEAEFMQLEDSIGFKLPLLFKEYFLYKCVVGTDGLNLPETPSDNPLGPLLFELNAWAPLLKSGYFPFAEYEDGWGPICFDCLSSDNPDEYKVVWFEHEQLFDIGEQGCGDRSQIKPMEKLLYESFGDMVSA